MTIAADPIDRLAIDTIRTLSIDGVQKANSGHPGAPMGMAPMAYVLWTRFLRHAPTPSRLAGPRPVRALRRPRLDAPLLAPPPDRLRRLARRPQGIPPVGLDHAGPPGVRTHARRRGDDRAARPGRSRTRVGMAIAERRLAAEFNRPGHAIVDHWTYVICSDGDLQEGIASEAASLAGHLRLGKLVAPLRRQPDPARRARRRWPSARTSSARFDAYGWHTQRVDDGNDVEAIAAAIEAARRDARPSTHRRPHPHRLRQPQQAGHARRPTARRSVRTRCG